MLKKILSYFFNQKKNLLNKFNIHPFVITFSYVIIFSSVITFSFVLFFTNLIKRPMSWQVLDQNSASPIMDGIFDGHGGAEVALYVKKYFV